MHWSGERMTIKTTAVSRIRNWRLSASWGTNWVPLTNPSEDYSTIIVRGLRGGLNLAPITPRDASLSYSEGDCFQSGNAWHHTEVNHSRKRCEKKKKKNRPGKDAIKLVIASKENWPIFARYFHKLFIKIH